MIFILLGGFVMLVELEVPTQTVFGRQNNQLDNFTTYLDTNFSQVSLFFPALIHGAYGKYTHHRLRDKLGVARQAHLLLFYFQKLLLSCCFQPTNWPHQHPHSQRRLTVSITSCRNIGCTFRFCYSLNCGLEFFVCGRHGIVELSCAYKGSSFLCLQFSCSKSWNF